MGLVRGSLGAVVTLCSAWCASAGETLDLSGTWRFALDPSDRGVAGQWWRSAPADTIRLPGTTDEAEKGPAAPRREFTGHLSRPHPYRGAAWYQREVEIPAAWRGFRPVLLLERSKVTAVWFDDTPCGTNDSLGARQVYELPAAAAPGTHRLTVRVDNARLPPASGHQLSDDTQTDWNGILGRIELQAREPVWLRDLRIHPDAAARRIRVTASIGNETGAAGKGAVDWSVRPADPAPTGGGKELRGRREAAWTAEGGRIEWGVDLGDGAPLWDEFSPNLHEVRVTLRPEAGGLPSCTVSARFGLRDFRTAGTQFTINGRPVFLRGKHDACVFPLTGHPPMDVEGWLRVFRIAKEYGINHYRFHSWTPPEAAFEAADRIGIYLQPELYNFGGDLEKDAARAEYTRREGLRILADFGNHPSFVMFSLGNEMGGGRDVRAAIVREFRTTDPRRLYAQASNYEFWRPELAAGDDYWTTVRTRPGEEWAVRGSFAHVDAPLGHVQTGPPCTTTDYARAIAGVPVPVVGHEVGQYQVRPDPREAARYTGVLRAWNLETFRDRLERRGLGGQADAFFRASGALAVRCYREDVEAALRTPGFGGFQLLDLQDFPGQGTALVGILNAFMESKGLIEPARWREFCCETVPLALMDRRSWTAGQTLEARVKVAHYGPAPLRAAAIRWTLEAGGRELAAGTLPPVDLPAGALTAAGSLRVALGSAPAPCRAELRIAIGGTPFVNRYDVWIYPGKVDLAPAANVALARTSGEAAAKLAGGGRVVWMADPATLTNAVPGFFASDFWCYPMFRGISVRAKKPVAPGTLGLLCDPSHPALAGFPTAFHSDWQWWPVAMNSAAAILDGAPAELRPIVQVIDNFDADRNHRLGLVFECRAGRGKLLFCGADLPSLAPAHPEARQLLRSLLDYAASDRFDPSVEIDAAQFSALAAGRL